MASFTFDPQHRLIVIHHALDGCQAVAAVARWVHDIITHDINQADQLPRHNGRPDRR